MTRLNRVWLEGLKHMSGFDCVLVFFHPAVVNVSVNLPFWGGVLYGCVLCFSLFFFSFLVLLVLCFFHKCSPVTSGSSYY